MLDCIEIKDLLLRTIIGINADERTNLQDVVVNIWLFADTRAAAKDDDITQTVNYRTITKNVIQLVETSEFFLVETLATEVARVCFEEPTVQRARVSIEKPGALRFARSVGVTIERDRGDIE